MPEAARCPKCHWGRLTYPVDIEEQRCVGCRGKHKAGLMEREPYRSEDNCYGQQGVLDDDG